MITGLPLSNCFTAHVEHRIQSVARSKAPTKIHELVCQLCMLFRGFSNGNQESRDHIPSPRRREKGERYASKLQFTKASFLSSIFFPLSRSASSNADPLAMATLLVLLLFLLVRPSRSFNHWVVTEEGKIEYQVSAGNHSYTLLAPWIDCLCVLFGCRWGDFVRCVGGL